MEVLIKKVLSESTYNVLIDITKYPNASYRNRMDRMKFSSLNSLFYQVEKLIKYDLIIKTNGKLKRKII